MPEKICTSPELHEMYPGRCPCCNPEEYRRAVAQAPEGQPVEREREPAPTRRTGPVGTHDAGYSDTY